MYPNEEKLSSFSTKTVFANAQLVTPMRKILYIHPVLGRCGAASQARDGAAPRGCPRGRVFARLTLAEPGAAGLARRQPSDLCCSAGFASPSPLPSCPHRSSMDRFLWESASFLQDGFAGRTWTPPFAKLSVGGGVKEKIAPVHPDCCAGMARCP
jgi:hypothetical protein